MHGRYIDHYDNHDCFSLKSHFRESPPLHMKSLFIGALALLCTALTGFAQSKTVWISSKVAVDLKLGDSLSGKTITFTLKDSGGKSLGQATVPADQALGASLATFFQSVSDAIKELTGTPTDLTAFTVTVNAEGTTVANLAGDISLTDAQGNTTKVDVGTGAVIKPDGTTDSRSLAQIVADEKAAGTAGNANSVTSSLSGALKTAADEVKAGAQGADGGLAKLASVVKVLSAANPSAAADYVKMAVDAVTGGSSNVVDKATALAAIVEAASGSLSADQLAAVKTAAIAAGANNGLTNATRATEVGAARGTGDIKISTPLTQVDPTVISPSGGNG